MTAPEWDIEVYTATLSTVEDTVEDTVADTVENLTTPTVPIIAVTVPEPVLIVGPLGPVDAFRFFTMRMGMQALAMPHRVLNVDLPGWRVCCAGRHGVVLDPDGDLWASGVSAFPMWRALTAQHGDRAAVFYAPGIQVPGLNTGESVVIPAGRLAVLGQQGLLIGGMVQVVEVPELPAGV